ncbi:MAG TPA: UDP-N-acetylglucosamine 2-epimerase (non-hydrolyzing) [Vicinamibacteria bacterium]
MKRLKVLTLVGTRPELIKLSRVIAALDAATDHVLVHSGQNFDPELSQVFFDELEIRPPDHLLGVAGGTVAEQIARIIERADVVLAQERPDALLIYGDTNTGLAVIPAKRRHIPVFHMEAGNRCFDQRVPEETNRKIIDHLADINLPLTEHARRYLLAEGLRPETVIKTGSTLKEVLGHYRRKVDASDVRKRLGLVAGEYFVVSAHREENVDSLSNLSDLLASLRALVEVFGHRVIVSTHPRTRQRLEVLAAEGAHPEDPRIEFLKPFGFCDYIRLQRDAACVLSDSGTLTEESSLLGFPAVTIRQAHERPEGMDEGTLVMSGLGPERVLQAVTLVQEQSRAGFRPRPVPDYDVDNVSQKVVRIIVSYVDYVNRTVWGQPS